jgi:hypothetical protein
MTNTSLDDVIAKLTEARERFGNIDVFMTDNDGFFVPVNIELAKVVLNTQDDLVSLSDFELERLSDETSNEPTLESVNEWFDQMQESDRTYFKTAEAVFKMNHDSWVEEQAVLARHFAAPFSAVIA